MVLLSLPVGAQGLSLEECQRLAWTNYPLLKKYNLIEQTTSYSIKNINRGYLPQLSFNGQASYQSDAANLPDVLSDMLESNGYDYKGLGKDQYKLALDLNQVIWDGGNMEAQKKVTKLEGKVQTAQTDVDMYAIRERVNELFFGILFIEDKIKLNQELQTLLQDNCRKLENRLAHGTAMKADVNVMWAEYLKAQQDMTALASMKTSYQQMLAIFTGKEASDITNLQKPEASMPASHENQRPELNLFAAQMAKTDAQKKQLNAGICPKLSLFAQGYYGYPGFDMFGDMFDHNLSLNGIVGVKFSWNIGRLYTHKNDKRKLDLARRQILVQQQSGINAGNAGHPPIPADDGGGQGHHYLAHIHPSGGGIKAGTRCDKRERSASRDYPREPGAHRPFHARGGNAEEHLRIKEYNKPIK